MKLSQFKQLTDFRWEIEPYGDMRVPGIIFASADLLRQMEDDVGRQLRAVASLPGIRGAALAMPDAHVGYGFPIGGIGVFDPAEGGVISAGGVGFDIACGVRCLRTGLHRDDILTVQEELADTLFAHVPCGVGSTGGIRLSTSEIDDMLKDGAKWAVRNGYGTQADLDHTEEGGRMPGADPSQVSDTAKKRQRDEMGTLGSGNHYLEIQYVEEVFDEKAATAYGLAEGDAVVCIHCGSRGLGHQIGTDYLARMLKAMPRHGIPVTDRELACAPAASELGQDYLGAMRSGINCALANRQIITHLVREAFAEVLPEARLSLIYDVSHNTCKEETHRVDGRERRLLVHRKGATRALPPGHPSLPHEYAKAGQPAFIGGSMGTASYILTGTQTGMDDAFGSICHGAGRAMSRKKAKASFRGREVIEKLHRHGIHIRTSSYKGAAEEAPEAYKDIDMVIDATTGADIASKVTRMRPLVCVKG
ncbi:tRNA-splicing ligase RtcB [Desulfobaculum xiamenense]|uniref:tRNA-splicing ligase RtcB n=1 Tax=Desulfobaculum xiamenense TaxID=995050 RepID=A0A846QHV9_9BACT|nr:RtcB family protein [Desulfobaculum xiamenense]NJB66617.1 tRNA-splicing ligase RtcB [Desulfobaculum xiamenense]